MFYLSAQEDVRAFWNAGRASRFFAPPPAPLLLLFAEA